MQVKSDGDAPDNGIGQVLILAVVACITGRCSVQALVLHPKRVRVTFTMIPEYILAPST